MTEKMKAPWEMLTEIESLKATVAEQLRTIKALNSCIGGETSNTLENIRRSEAACGERTLLRTIDVLKDKVEELMDINYETMQRL